MMTIAEVFLLIWALGATVAAVYLYRDAELAKRIIFDILDNDELRENMVTGHKQAMREIDAQ